MAEYGILLGIKDIKGNCALADFKDHLIGFNVNFASSSFRAGSSIATRRISVTQSHVAVTLGAGKWIAELQQACYVNKNLGDVTVVQLAQAVDKTATAKPTVLQKLTLKNAVVTSLDQAWMASDGPRTVGMTLEFEKFLLEIGGSGPIADFTLRNFAEGAV